VGSAGAPTVLGNVSEADQSNLREAEAMMRTTLSWTLRLRPEGYLLGPDSCRDQIAMKSSRRTVPEPHASGRRSKLVAQAAIVIAAALLPSTGMLHASDISWSRAAGNPGDISVGANWTGGSVPMPTDNA